MGFVRNKKYSVLTTTVSVSSKCIPGTHTPVASTSDLGNCRKPTFGMCVSYSSYINNYILAYMIA